MPSTPPDPLEFRREPVPLLRSCSRTVRELTNELGCSPQSLRKRARRLDVYDGRAEGLDEREELRRLRREPRRLTEEREILRRAGLLRQGGRDPAVILRFIAAKAEQVEPIGALARLEHLLGVVEPPGGDAQSLERLGTWLPLHGRVARRRDRKAARTAQSPSLRQRRTFHQSLD